MALCHLIMNHLRFLLLTWTRVAFDNELLEAGVTQLHERLVGKIAFV